MAKISTLIDDFSAGSLNAVLWRTQTPPTPDPASTITIDDGNLRIVQASKAITLYSQSTYDWTASALTVGPVDGRVHIIVTSDIQITNDGTTVTFGNPFGTPYGTVAYNAATMRYFRIRSSGSTVYAEYSADYATWTAIASGTPTIPTAASVGIEVGANSQVTAIGGINISEPATPITVGNTTHYESYDYADPGSVTFSFTMGSVTNGLLVVAADLWQDTPGSGAVTSLTYNGVALTKAVDKTQEGMRAELWYLVNPPSGTHNIVATINGSGTDSRRFGVISLGGVSQTNPIGNTATGLIDSAVGGSLSASITAIDDGELLIDTLSKYESANLVTKRKGQTSFFNTSGGGGYSATQGAGSYKVVKNGAHTMRWDGTYYDDAAYAVIGVRPFVSDVFNWKGYEWNRRDFGGDPHYNGQYLLGNVSDPDGSDYITLRVTNPTGGSPYAGEMFSTKAGWGYGTYTIVVGSRLDTVTDNFVFGGLFTYSDSGVTNNEIDVNETSSWGSINPPATSHNYFKNVGGVKTGVDDPYYTTADSVTTHVMTWLPGSITFDSYAGTGTGGTLLKHTVATDSIPTPTDEQLFINAWVTDVAGTPATTPETSVVVRDFSFTPYGATAASGASSSITATTASAGGTISTSGGAVITERGIVYGTSANPTTANSKKTATGTTGTFTASLTGLTGNTAYHWRAYAIYDGGTVYGSDQTFTTLPVTPTVTTIHDITDTGGQVDASIPAGGGASITARGVVYATTANPTLSDGVVTAGSGSGTFTASLTGLAGSTTYYVRSYATNAQGTSYSTQASFMTAQTPSAPTVTTGTATSTTATSSGLNGSEVTLDGSQSVTERGIVFSDTETVPTTADRKVAAVTAGLGTYNVTLTGLQPETTYYARAYAINSIGTGYGSVITFTTPALFVSDDGDGYWTWSPDGSDAVIGRSQATPAHASANLMLADLGLEDGEDYTFYYSAATSDEGAASVLLQWYDGETKHQQAITAGTPYTFTHDETMTLWSIRLFVTGASAEADTINATFEDMYLAKEAEFSGFVPFVAKGVTEIKLENNWLLDKRREASITTIFSALSGLSWHPFDIATEGLGWFEIGDRFTIEDDQGSERSVVLWNASLTVDGGIKESLFTRAPELTETDYKKAGKLGGLWKTTKIEVDKNKQTIDALVEDIYSLDGTINTKFSSIEQDVNAITQTVQSSGGVNLVKNSVMYAFDDDGNPDKWERAETGSLTIQASPESVSGGGISGNIFALSGETVSQTVPVRKDVAFISEENKQYYSFTARVKKNTVGDASITLSNRNETHTIELPDQTEYYWETVRLEGLLPLDDHFDIDITSDSDANLQVTDVMLSPGKNSRQWTQANGEAMNTSVQTTDDGITVRSNVFKNDYTKIDALGFEVHKHEAGGERVFGFNGDETNVRKLKADNQISMAPVRVVPIDYGTYKGWAWTRTEDI